MSCPSNSVLREEVDDLAFKSKWVGETDYFFLREEVDDLAEHSGGFRRGGSFRRRMSRGVSSFRRQVGISDLSHTDLCIFSKQVFHSLQNLRHKNRRKSKLEEGLKENNTNLSLKRHQKKKAPEPPRFVRKPLGSPKKSEEEKKRLEAISIPSKNSAENEYEGTPRKPVEVVRPPQPAPRKSKLVQSPPPVEEEQEESEDEDEDEDEEDEDEYEYEVDEEEEDLEKVKSRVQNQYYNKQTLTMVEGKERVENGRAVIGNEFERENEKTSEADTVDEEYNDNTKDPNSESRWDSEEDDMEDEIENIDIDQDNLHDEVARHNEVEEEIRLRKPTPGSKIADLTNIIEAQLHSRAARSII